MGKSSTPQHEATASSVAFFAEKSGTAKKLTFDDAQQPVRPASPELFRHHYALLPACEDIMLPWKKSETPLPEEHRASLACFEEQSLQEKKVDPGYTAGSRVCCQ